MTPETFKIVFILLMTIALLAVFFLVVMTYLLVEQNEEIRKTYPDEVNWLLEPDFELK